MTVNAETHDDEIESQFTFNLRAMFTVVAFAALLLGWIADRSRANAKISGLQARIDATEIQQDKLERALILTLKVGDKVADHPEFLAFADYVLTTEDEDYSRAISYIYHPNEQGAPSGCDVYIFDLEHDSIEGTNEFLVVVSRGLIVKVQRGYSVNS